MSFLIGENMTGGYGGADILNNCTIGVEKGEIAVIVGPNGAGKSTAMKAIFGMLNLREGRVVMDGEEITSLTPQARVHKGMGFVPQNHNVFTSMTVQENLEMGAFIREDDFIPTMEQVFELFPILREKRNLAAGGLSGGQQQMLAIARALMGRPSCLLLDEPSMGLAPILVQQIFDVVSNLKALNVTVLLVEQNAFGALKIADRGYVMETGQITLDGPAETLIADPRIRESYLGI